MKKLFLGSASLLIFAVSISIFNMACSKESRAQTGGGTTIVGKVLIAQSNGSVKDFYSINESLDSSTIVQIPDPGISAQFSYDYKSVYVYTWSNSGTSNKLITKYDYVEASGNNKAYWQKNGATITAYELEH